ncbi:MAG: hypothetical protein KJ950_00740 [Proteobacteria bacterium]|nr:hypothetical protein [Pseudomonadota bacterium]
MNQDKILKKLITKYCGKQKADEYFSFKLEGKQVLIDTAQELLESLPPSFGACALISATWAGFLRDKYSVPAIVVAGDLEIEDKKIFKCRKNLPVPKKTGKLVLGKWDGHCWIEVDGIIGDLSIFRTAYAVKGPSILKEYIVSNFGIGRGAFLCPKNEFPTDLKYVPKYVLDRKQINGLISGMMYQLEHGNNIGQVK